MFCHNRDVSWKPLIALVPVSVPNDHQSTNIGVHIHVQTTCAAPEHVVPKPVRLTQMFQLRRD